MRDRITLGSRNFDVDRASEPGAPIPGEATKFPMKLWGRGTLYGCRNQQTSVSGSQQVGEVGQLTTRLRIVYHFGTRSVGHFIVELRVVSSVGVDVRRGCGR